MLCEVAESRLSRVIAQYRYRCMIGRLTRREDELESLRPSTAARVAAALAQIAVSDRHRELQSECSMPRRHGGIGQELA